MMHRWSALVVLVIAGFIFAGAPAQATTLPAEPIWLGEQDHPQILSHVLGETMAWGPTNIWGTKDIIGTTVQAVRVNEDDPTLSFGMLNADRVWGNVMVKATAVAVFSNYAQSFGYQPDNSPTWVKLFDITSGNQLGTLDQSEILDLSSTVFTWVRKGGGNPYSTDESANIDTMDHVLTYRLDPLNQPEVPPTKVTYFLFWEDLHRRGTSPIPEWPSDHDFNDLVIRVDAYLPNSPEVVVPEPATAGALGLLGLGLLLRRKR